MKRPLSQLIHAPVQEGDGSPRVITLHRHNQRARDVAEYGIAAAPTGRVTALESYKGVFIGWTIVGYTWFIGPFEHPSPLYFGDALAEIERFLWDEIDRQPGDDAELPFLVGVEQGAIMAIAAAAAVPDLLSGVIAIDGFLPLVPGWEPPLAPLDRLPVLLIDDPAGRPSNDVLVGESLAATLRQWGAVVERDSCHAAEVPSALMAGWVARHTPRRRPKSG